MTKPLVIVESPAKARTISGFLGDGYVVESSIGHIRDLPRNAAEVPASHKSEPWARLGVDTENDFKPLYVVPKDKKDQVKKLKALLKDASELYLATDEDREGESIAWHLLETLNPKVPVKRMVFHEITAQAIEEAIENSRDLDRHLVDAQEARRILDRLVGYEVSPVLWKMVGPSCRPAGCRARRCGSSSSASANGCSSRWPATGISKAPSPPGPTVLRRARSTPSCSPSTAPGSPPGRTSRSAGS